MIYIRYDIKWYLNTYCRVLLLKEKGNGLTYAMGYSSRCTTFKSFNHGGQAVSGHAAGYRRIVAAKPQGREVGGPENRPIGLRSRNIESIT